MLTEQYRPPGRSARTGRSQADNDVFEGLPVKQWGQQYARISLAPPTSEQENSANDKWGDLPMPRDYQLLQPWTQQLLRLARSGKVGTKRKPADPDSMDEDGGEEENSKAEEGKGSSGMLDDRGYRAKKWKPVPEALLVPEHKHFEFLAKRRKGLPSLYGPELASAGPIPMRKTRVQKTGPEGEISVYEVLVPEGQPIDGELSTEAAAEIKPTTDIAPGTVIEGVGIANEDGVVVAEHLKPAAAAAANPRRNRPPPKKKGGPGRGKKRVTFTNPDGSTYTKIVPNATKIIPAPGQTVKHVSKGEEAAADITAEQAAASNAIGKQGGEGQVGGDGEGDEDGDEGEDDGDEDDDDREEGEVSDEDAPDTTTATPAPVSAPDSAANASKEQTPSEKPATPPPAPASEPVARDASSSPELPLAKTSHSRQGSSTTVPLVDTVAEVPAASGDAMEVDSEVPAHDPDDAAGEVAKFEDGEEDLLGNLEKELEGGQ